MPSQRAKTVCPDSIKIRTRPLRTPAANHVAKGRPRRMPSQRAKTVWTVSRSELGYRTPAANHAARAAAPNAESACQDCVRTYQDQNSVTAHATKSCGKGQAAPNAGVPRLCVRTVSRSELGYCVRQLQIMWQRAGRAECRVSVPRLCVRTVSRSELITAYASCKSCDKGQAAPNQSPCQECIAGRYEDTSPSSVYTCNECEQCSQLGDTRIKCGPISAGSCVYCPAGNFVNDTTCTKCASCPAGQFMSGCGGENIGSCKTCPHGYYTSSEGQGRQYALLASIPTRTSQPHA